MNRRIFWLNKYKVSISQFDSLRKNNNYCRFIKKYFEQNSLNLCSYYNFGFMTNQGKDYFDIVCSLNERLENGVLLE